MTEAAHSQGPTDLDIGALLRRARSQRGLTQRDLASITGVAQTTIARIESGRHQPTVATLSRLLDGAGFRATITLVNTRHPSMLLEQHRDAILEAATRHRISRVRVFGSVARGEDRPDSDLDLLVDFETGASLFDQAEFAGEVEDLLGLHVDVISADGLNPSRSKFILQDARDL